MKEWRTAGEALASVVDRLASTQPALQSPETATASLCNAATERQVIRSPFYGSSRSFVKSYLWNEHNRFRRVNWRVNLCWLFGLSCDQIKITSLRLSLLCSWNMLAKCVAVFLTHQATWNLETKKVLGKCSASPGSHQYPYPVVANSSRPRSWYSKGKTYSNCTMNCFITKQKLTWLARC